MPGRGGTHVKENSIDLTLGLCRNVVQAASFPSFSSLALGAFFTSFRLTYITW